MPSHANANHRQPRRHKRYLSYASRTLVPARYRAYYESEQESMGDLPVEPAAAPKHTMSDELRKLALRLGTQGPHKTLPTTRLIQLLFNGVYMIKTTRAVFVWEHPYYPQLYIPALDLHSYFDARSADLQITPGEPVTSDAGDLLATHWTLTVRDKSIDKVLCFADELPTAAALPLQGLVKIDFASVDQWFEESTPIFVHPKDPFKRIDILQSTRHVVVKIHGRVVADTNSSMHLYETGLPCRFYLPLTRVDASVLRPSPTKTQCPYKGEAEYYHVEFDSDDDHDDDHDDNNHDPNRKEKEKKKNGKKVLYEDIVWYYNRPLLESAKIEGLVCFYNEKVEIEVDGEVLDSPRTVFSGKPPNSDSKEMILDMGSFAKPLQTVKEEVKTAEE
ncbi:hypothetical protein SMMN14_07830 [Sphaerulina musiva]